MALEKGVWKRAWRGGYVRKIGISTNMRKLLGRGVKSTGLEIWASVFVHHLPAVRLLVNFPKL